MATIQETVNQFVQQNPVLARQLRDLCIQYGVFQPTATQPSTPVAPTAPAPAPAAPAPEAPAPVQPSVPPVVRVLFDERVSTAPIAEQVAQAEATAEPVVETAEPEVESETPEEADDIMTEATDEIPAVAHRDVGTEEPEEPPFEETFDEEVTDDVGEMVENPAPGEFTVEQFMEIQRPESHYIVTFEIDQRDADDITVSSYQSGKISKEELIKLSILAHYRNLSAYDGGWESLGPLNDFLEEYLRGNFYDQCNRFKVNGIEIHGYNADTNQFYVMDVPGLGELGIEDIDEAYRQYFGGDESGEE